MNVVYKQMFVRCYYIDIVVKYYFFYMLTLVFTFKGHCYETWASFSRIYPHSEVRFRNLLDVSKECSSSKGLLLFHSPNFRLGSKST